MWGGGGGNVENKDVNKSIMIIPNVGKCHEEAKTESVRLLPEVRGPGGASLGM